VSGSLNYVKLFMSLFYRRTPTFEEGGYCAHPCVHVCHIF